ncbi:MAG TPA: hypothetical protein VKU91_04800, partial [Acidimicrobiales bacterium]|nr:hypothetical protein [Acidimicrobiales bacterium]
WLARYLAAAWPAPPGGPVAGPLVAIPLEGTLESAWMGFWAPRRRSLLALPALTAHGYRPVLLSARPAVEVGDHCRAWRLAGGVAEGGGSVYDGARDREMAVEGPGGWVPALGVLERAAGAPPSAPTVTASAGESTDELVRRLVGHAPGGCPRCAPPARRPGSGLLLEPVLDAIGASTTVRLASAGRLAWRALAATVREGAGQLGS